MLTLSSSIREVPLVGEKQSEKLSNLGIFHVVDLLTHFPSKYIDTTQLHSISEILQNGSGTSKVEIISISNSYTRSRKVITKARITDGESTVDIAWFNQPYLPTVIRAGNHYLMQLKISQKSGKLYCVNYEQSKEDGENAHLGRIAPQYRQTARITSKWIRSRVGHILKSIDLFEQIELPSAILEKHNLIPIHDALNRIHFPDSHESIKQARKRLVFDELLTLQLEIEEKKSNNTGKKANIIQFDDKVNKDFLKLLKFTPTEDQTKSYEDMKSDMLKEIPMNRLINGDVGSGKTLVAAMAILQVLNRGKSAILIAPTTILATQHYENFSKLFEKLNVQIDFITSNDKRISSDVESKLIIGTHAILHSADIQDNCALVVVDEQHRFGVKQRAKLREMVSQNASPHYLMMSATPIPRTLITSLYGDIEVSYIETMPTGRGETKTHLVPREKREECYSWVRDQVVNKGTQVYIIFPLIEDDPEQTDKSVKKNFKELSSTIFKDLNCSLLHGKLKNNEKSKVMDAFQKGKTDILFSTTVIEVGIDVPTANIIVIEGAEFYGLAQLHQLRGRVGRSSEDAYCYLIPSVEKITEEQTERLDYFASHRSGFKISEYDLKSRGPGEVYGLKQSGLPELLIASLFDIKTVKITKEVARNLIKSKKGELPSTIFSLRRELTPET